MAPMSLTGGLAEWFEGLTTSDKRPSSSMRPSTDRLSKRASAPVASFD